MVKNIKSQAKCDFCDGVVSTDVDYSRTQTIFSNLGNQTISEKYCSLDCKIASEIVENSIFMGFSSDLISHLRDDHGLTKNEIKAGVDRILERGDVLLGINLVDWERYY